MPSSRLRRALVASAIATTLAATGCGITDKLENGLTSAVKDKDPGQPTVDTPTPRALIRKADQALRDATSVRIVASSRVDGERLDLTIAGDAADAFSEGTLEFDAGTVDFRVVRGRAWVSGSGQVVRRLTGGITPGEKWAPAGPGESTALLRSLTAGAFVRAFLDGGLPRPQRGALIGTVVQDGVPAFRLMVRNKGERRPFPAVVAADGTWRLLKVGEPTMEAYAEFSDYDDVQRVGAPRPNQLAR